MDLARGSLIGPYEVLDRLGAGGMGEVYRARDSRLGREVAIKVLSGPRMDSQSRGRFKREARLASAVSHANVLALHDVGEHEGLPYLVTELLQGKTLRELVAAGPTQWRTAVSLMLQVADGLAAAHEKGIVHRDLKPENLFLTNGDQIKILDFGIALTMVPEGAESAAGSERFTTTGTTLGTPSYMSPEQLCAQQVDARSDLFSFGCVFYELLAGRRPFVASTGVDIAFAILHHEPPPLPPSTPPSVRRVVLRCLEKQPANRWQSAHELSSTLRGLVGAEPAQRTSTLDRDAARPPAPAVQPSFLAELKSRRVFRALAAYGIGAFAVLQITEPIMHGLHWPDAVLSYVVIALAVGFALVVGLAWIFDVDASRIERASNAPRLRGVRTAAVLAGISAIAAAPAVTWYFFARNPAESSPHSRATPTSPSIGVLPFADMSPGKDQEYFSDGIAEEILNALARVDGLKVAGRTSSFSFKGKSEDLRGIGEKLSVANVLEGSVRKEANHVRITAQLIATTDGYHVWSQTYDRELTGIFAVQDEIAQAVVAALKPKLLAAAAGPSAIRPTRDPEAYRLFLLAQSLGQFNTEEGMGREEVALKKVVALEPSYAPAWAALAALHGGAVRSAPMAEVLQRAHQALDEAERAVSLDPEFGEGYSARAYIRGWLLWDWTGAKADLDHALALDPRSPTVLSNYGGLVQKLGRLKEAIAVQRKVLEIDPLDSDAWNDLSAYLLQDGQVRAARDAHARAREISPDQGDLRAGSAAVPTQLALFDLFEGHAEEALAAWARFPEESSSLMGIAMAQHQLGHAHESDEALVRLAARVGGPEGNTAYRVAAVHAWRGERDRAFHWLDRAFDRHEIALRLVKIDPLLRNLHGDQRFGAFLKKMNLPLD